MTDKLGRYMDISCHTSDFYRPIFRMCMSTEWMIPQMTKRWQRLFSCFVYEKEKEEKF